MVFIVIATATTASTELYNCTTQCRTLHLAITQHRAAPEHSTHTNTNLVSFSHSLQLPPIQLTSSPLNNNIAPTVELESIDGSIDEVVAALAVVVANTFKQLSEKKEEFIEKTAEFELQVQKLRRTTFTSAPSCSLSVQTVK